MFALIEDFIIKGDIKGDVFYNNRSLFQALDYVLDDEYADKKEFPDDGKFRNKVHRLFLDKQHSIDRSLEASVIYLEYNDTVNGKKKSAFIGFQLTEDGKIRVFLEKNDRKTGVRIAKTAKEAMKIAISMVDKIAKS